MEKLYNTTKDKLDAKVSGWIDDMIKDIYYLYEMKKLEEPNYDKEPSLHIVPVSGLVVGVFCRLQNECRTVCEFWEIDETLIVNSLVIDNDNNNNINNNNNLNNNLNNKNNNKNKSSNIDINKITALHEAIEVEDYDMINMLVSVKDNPYINSRDKDGETPLFKAFSLSNSQSILKVFFLFLLYYFFFFILEINLFIYLFIYLSIYLI